MLPTWLTAFLPCILTGHPRPSWRTALTFPTTADEKLHSADIQPISLLTSTAHSLKELLDSKKATSRGIIEQCMGQIDTHNEQGMRLRAIIPELSRETILSFADELDMEREQGRLRGPFHGVPIIIKVSGCGDLRRQHRCYMSGHEEIALWSSFCIALSQALLLLFHTTV